MTERYIPRVQEAAIPEDGAWAELGNENVLVLSIPEWEEVVERTYKGYRYAWLYDREKKTYIFCFRLEDGTEQAVAFPKDHAGLLLQDGRAYEPFSILITSRPLAEADDDTPSLLLRKVRLRRHPEAGW